MQQTSVAAVVVSYRPDERLFRALDALAPQVARIVVVDGKAFHVPREIDIGVLKIGEQVTITYEIVDGQLRVVSIRVV